MARTKRTIRLRPVSDQNTLDVEYVLMPLDSKSEHHLIMKKSINNIKVLHKLFMTNSLSPMAIKTMHKFLSQATHLNSFQRDFMHDYDLKRVHLHPAKKYIGPMRYRKYVIRSDGLALVKLKTRRH